MSATAVVEAAPYTVETRRSSRLALAIPVELTIRDVGGEVLHECTRTLYLNKHGAKLRTRRRHPAGTEMDVRIPHLERMQKAWVIWSAPDEKEGLYETAIELAHAENFWGVQFPPDDWLNPRTTADKRDNDSNGEDPRFLSAGIPAAQHAYAVNATLNSLICLLEKKGLFQRSELAELTQRFLQQD